MKTMGLWDKYPMFAIPNGGARSKITGALLKAEGVRPGVLDYFVAFSTYDHSGLFIEFKKPGGKPSAAQIKMIELLESYGFKCVVHDSTQAAINTVLKYLGEKKNG